jgi:hypothetical protein
MYFYRASLLVGLLCSCLPAATYTFRQGVNSYSSGHDVAITNQYSGNGLTYRDVTDACYLLSTYEARTLLRFDGLTIGAGEK